MPGPKERKAAERELEAKGFTQLGGRRGKGSHQVWQNEDGVSVTVPAHGKEIAAGTWRTIDRQATQAKEAADKRAAEQSVQKANEGVAKAGGKGGQSQGQQDRRHGGKSDGKTKGRGLRR